MKKEQKTGQTIKMTDVEIETLNTYHKKRSRLHILIDHLATENERNEKEMWRAVRDLWPELGGYDLIIDWKNKHVRVRHELSNWEKEQQKDVL